MIVPTAQEKEKGKSLLKQVSNLKGIQNIQRQVHPLNLQSSYSSNQQALFFQIKPSSYMKCIDQLDQLSRRLLNQDFSCLYKDENSLKLIRFFAQKRYLLPNSARQTVKYFLDLVNSRIEFFPFASLIYATLLHQIQKLSDVYQYSGSRRNISVDQNHHNRIFQHLVQEAECRPRRQSIYYLNNGKERRISLVQYMNQHPQFFQDKKWREIMDIVIREIQKRNIEEVRHDNQEIIKIIKKLDYSKKIYKKVVISLSCLGCAEFLILNWNIYDQNINQGKLVLGGKISDMIAKSPSQQQKRKSLKNATRQICALLNSGGGVILYSCETIYMSVIPRGQFLSKQQGMQIERLLKMDILKKIKPQLDFGINIILSFLRILKDPILEEKQYDTKQIPEQMFLGGLFVVRITVRPTINAFYTYEDNGQLYQAFRYKSLSENAIQDRPVKQTFRLGSRSQNFVSNILNMPYLEFDHQVCSTSKYCLKTEQFPIQKPFITQQSQDYESKFQNATAMVVKQQNFGQFKKRLQKLHFENYCQFPFPTSRIKGANVALVLYHNKTNTEITSMINHNSEFQFGGRKTVSVAITDYIKLVNRLNRNFLPYQQFENLQGDQRCILQVYKCRNQYNQQQFYLKVLSKKAVKKCTLFVYLVCNHFNQRAQLRNPPKLQNLQLYQYRTY